MPEFELDHIDGVPPHGHAIGLQLIEKRGNTSRFRLPYGEHLVGDPDTGVIHGGVITAMLDNACGHAVRTENIAGVILIAHGSIGHLPSIGIFSISMCEIAYSVSAYFCLCRL